MRKLLFCMCCLCFFPGCSSQLEEEMKEAWVVNEVAIKSGEYRARKMEECRNQIVMEAEIFVDSLVSNSDLFSKIVEEKIPEKPLKPEFIPLDTASFENHSVNPVLKRQ